MATNWRYYESTPKKPKEECKSLSFVIMKDAQPFCWVNFPNLLYRKDNLGLTQQQLKQNETAAQLARSNASNAANELVQKLNASKIAETQLSGKSYSVERLQKLKLING